MMPDGFPAVGPDGVIFRYGHDSAAFALRNETRSLRLISPLRVKSGTT
jgi:hypothetical protein